MTAILTFVARATIMLRTIMTIIAMTTPFSSLGTRTHRITITHLPHMPKTQARQPPLSI
jgi:hypothetical protein